MIQRVITLTKPGDYVFSLDEAGSEITIKGAFSLKGNERLKLNVTIVHNAPHTTANTLLKAVVDDTAHADIAGKIVVQKNAKGTNSFLKENVLLLSKKAKATAVPNLEILCDEVKCSHAATMGKIDPEQIFYLMSRGLSEAEAKSVIAKGFLDL